MSLLKKATPCLFLLLLSNFCHAQRITLVKQNIIIYDVDNIPAWDTYGYRYFLIQGEKKPRKVGYFGQHLREFLRSDSMAMADMRAYTRLKAWSLGTKLSTISFFGLFVAANTTKKALDPVNGNTIYGKGFIVLTAISLTVGTVLWSAPPATVRHAVNSYNSNLHKSSFHFNGIKILTGNGPAGSYPMLGLDFMI